MKSSLVIFGLCLLFQPESFAASKSSPITVTPDGERLLVVNPDSNSVSVVSVSGTPALEFEIPVGRFPQTVAVDSESRFAFAVNRIDDSLSVLDLDSREAIGCVPLQDEPFAVVTNGNYIFVSNQGSDSISVIHRATFLPLMTIRTAAAPKGMALSNDGSMLYITHFFSGKMSVVDTFRMQVIAEVNVSSSANISQAIELDPSNSLAYLPQTFSNSTNKALLFDTTVSPVVSIIDLQALVNLRTHRVSVDIVDEPVGIPIDVVRSTANVLYIANAASNDLSVINLNSNSAVAHLEVGANPRGIVLSTDERHAYVNNTLSGTVSVIDTATHSVLQEIVVTDIPLAPALLNGKKLFNDSSSVAIAREQWVACASCHFDGEHDGRTWFFKDGPRNTPSLLGVAETLPLHWSGDLDELHDVESTIRNIQAGTGLIIGPDNCTPTCDQGPHNAGRSEALDDLALYMDSLQFSSNPSLERNGVLEADAKSGQTIFHSQRAGCANCHRPPLYTDRSRHDVGTGRGALESKGSLFDTPSLRGINRTAAYLHDGSAATLRDVLVTRNPADQHGVTSHLTEFELTNLERFLAMLPFEGVINTSPASCEAPPSDIVTDDTLAVVEITLNDDEFNANDEFELDLNIAGRGVIDLYSAIQFPDASFVTLGDSMSVSAVNQIRSLRRELVLQQGVVVDVVKMDLPANLPSGSYSAFGIAVKAGTSVLNRDNWVGMDEIRFDFAN